MLEFYDHNFPIARKDHKCECCDESIKKGVKYSYEKGKYDGEMFTRKLCIECLKLLEEYVGWSGDNEFAWDNVDDWLQGEYCYGCTRKEECEKSARNCEEIREKLCGRTAGN